jgi:hypothetical protein
MLLGGDTPLTAEEEFEVKWAGHSMFAASAETVRDFHTYVLAKLSLRQTITTISHFIMGLIENPHVLQKAQAEIDSVIGNARLPTFSDRPFLPYGS